MPAPGLVRFFQDGDDIYLNAEELVELLRAMALDVETGANARGLDPEIVHGYNRGAISMIEAVERTHREAVAEIMRRSN